MRNAMIAIVGITMLAACAGKAPRENLETSAIIITSEAGAKLAAAPAVSFERGRGTGPVIEVWPGQTKQRIDGIGSSFTESSAYVLAHLEPERRRALMRELYGEGGANFSLARTVIGSTDFSVAGKQSYADAPGETPLESFSIGMDFDGFERAEHPGIRDETFDVLPMIQEALAIKRGQPDSSFRIVASAWTAPPWMKDIETWYVGLSEENNWQGTGGSLKPEHEATYADYLVRYLDAYDARGVDIWGLTPVNEPHGNSGQWESMHFTPETQRDYIAEHLGPALRDGGHGDIELLIYDQNRDDMVHWADVILGDTEAAQYVSGTAIHWYASTFRVFEDELDTVHDRFPAFRIIHTEGTIDNLGLEAPAGVWDPEGYKESGWFQNDAFWWQPNASDWAYAAEWAPNVNDHPLYTPVHRYARNIIVSLDHWVSGWIDWNVVLDHEGGPNHVGNLCGAPVMIDTATGEIYYTPIYYVLAQFSRTIRPGDYAIRTSTTRAMLGEDDLHASATVNDAGLVSVQVLNTTPRAIDYSLQIGDQHAAMTIPANALQTVQVATQ
ncbi:MAG: glycoside hydrolase family 30 beta sandwich domain-containing protein [Pseudomonadota bacterium]